LADDNDIFCNVVSDYIRSQPDIELLDIANDGIAAIEKIRKHKPDAALLNCVLPLIDGLEVLGRLRADSGFKPVCIMIFPSRLDDAIKKAYALGAEYCIIKPLDLEMLTDRIRLSRKQQIPPHKPDRIDAIAHPLIFERNNTVSVAGQIIELLRDIGMLSAMYGYRYVRTCILALVENPDLIHNVKKELYPEIAKKFNKPPGFIELKIHHAIRLVWEHGNIHALFEGGTYGTRKVIPSNEEFFVLILDKLRLEKLTGKRTWYVLNYLKDDKK